MSQIVPFVSDKATEHQTTLVPWLCFPWTKRKLINDMDEMFSHRFTCLRPPGPQNFVSSPFRRSCTHHTCSSVKLRVRQYQHTVISYIGQISVWSFSISVAAFLTYSYKHATVRKDMESEIGYKGVPPRKPCVCGLASPGRTLPLCPGLSPRRWRTTQQRSLLPMAGLVWKKGEGFFFRTHILWGRLHEISEIWGLFS